MEPIRDFFGIDWKAFGITIFVALLGFQAIIQVLHWFLFEFLGIETKAMREKKEEHKLLINTAKEVGEGIEGIGFSIPINVLTEKMEDLSKPMLLLGIPGRTIEETTAKFRNLPKGVYVVTVSEYSAAEKAGLQSGDVITKFGGNKITSIDELNTYKQNYSSGDTVSMTVSRNGKNITLNVVLEASANLN